MTMIIVSIVSIPLSLLIGAHLESVFISEEDTIGMNLARCEMERVNNTAYASLTAGTTTPVNCSSDLGYPSYTVSKTIAYVQGDDASAESLKKITIDVTKGSQNRGSLVTYRAKNVTFGPAP
ncbi:MAG: hypothetical protein HZA29_04090 [Candidatus Omnitrophica bacterium]|nr:hypothetical protein [Candidatus Omnitrophota bacterium]